MFWLIIGLIGIIIFAGPAIIEHILNLGNITGIILSLLALVYWYKGPEIKTVMCMTVVGKTGTVIFEILIAAYIILAVIETAFMIRSAADRPGNAETAVVLGCAVRNGRPSRVLQERLDAAYKYLNENPDVLAVLSGGQGADETVPEAQCMYDCLTAMGIDSSRLIIEDRSENTRQNLENSEKLLMDRGMSGKIAIVTSEFHCYRAQMIANRLGIDSDCIPAGTWWFVFPTYYLREIWGILYQAVV